MSKRMIKTAISALKEFRRGEIKELLIHIETTSGEILTCDMDMEDDGEITTEKELKIAFFAPSSSRPEFLIIFSNNAPSPLSSFLINDRIFIFGFSASIFITSDSVSLTFSSVLLETGTISVFIDFNSIIEDILS